MNKATPITIGRRVFYLEDPGYEKLQAYLGSLRDYFVDQEGHDEIMADIESRIAERFAEVVMSGRDEAIPLAEVTALMDAIGRPEDLSDSGAASPAKGKTRRRFFRDTEEGMLAGVCAGLARYLDKDPNLVRAIFVLAAFVLGIGILAYVVLWLVIPAAHSSADRLTMLGVPFTIGGLAALLPSGERVGRTRRGLERIVAIPFHLLRRIIAVVSSFLRRIFRGFGPLTRWVTGYAMVLGAIAFLATVTVFTLLSLTSFPTSYLDVSYAFFLEQIHYRFLALFTSLALLIPGVFVLAGGLGLLRRRSMLQPLTSQALLAGWFLAAVVSGALWVRTTMRWQAFEKSYGPYQAEEIVIQPGQLASIDADRLGADIRIVDGTTNEVRVEGRSRELERITYALNGESLVFTKLPDQTPCVICDREGILITVASPTPDSISTNPEPWRDYAAEQARVQAREDSIRAERLLLEAADSARRDSIQTARTREEAYPRQLEALLELPDSLRPRRLRQLADSLEALQ